MLYRLRGEYCYGKQGSRSACALQDLNPPALSFACRLSDGGAYRVLEVSGEEVGAAEGGGSDGGSQCVAEFGAAGGVGGEGEGGLDVGVQRRSAEVGQAGVDEDGVAEAFVEGGADEGDGGHAHPEGFAGGGSTGLGEGVERDVDIVVMGHMGAPDGGEFDAFGGDAVVGEDGAEVGLEGGAAGFGADEAEAGLINGADDFCPGFDDAAGEFIGVVHGAEGEMSGAVLGGCGVNGEAVVEAERAEDDPGAGEDQGLFDEEAVVGGPVVGVDHEVVDGGGAGGVGVAEPTGLDGGGFVGHDVEFVHVGGAAEFDEHVEAVGGDEAGCIAVAESGGEAEAI